MDMVVYFKTSMIVGIPITNSNHVYTYVGFITNSGRLGNCKSCGLFKCKLQNKNFVYTLHYFVCDVLSICMCYCFFPGDCLILGCDSMKMTLLDIKKLSPVHGAKPLKATR
jgi:hypothetical protein